MPLMEVVLTQRILAQDSINRWNYLASGVPASVSFSFALVSALGAIPVVGVYPEDEMIDLISELQDTAVTFEQIFARDVYSNTDFYSTTFVPALAGASSGGIVGPQVAFGFRTNKTRLDIRRGMKRFCGVNTVSFQADNQFSAATITALTALAAKMSEVLTYDDEGNTLTFTPVIVGRERINLGTVENPRYTYRYYETFAEQDDHLMSSITWDYYTGSRSQNSRQVGRGR